jgi:hypothetical protein
MEHILSSYGKSTFKLKIMSVNKSQKRSLVEFYKSLGIPSENTTHKKIGQTTLIFTKKVCSPAKENDSIYASLRYLKYYRNNQ